MRFEDINNLHNYIEGYRHSKVLCKECGKPTILHLWNFSNDHVNYGMFVRIVCPSCQWFDKGGHNEWWKDKERVAPQDKGSGAKQQATAKGTPRRKAAAASV